LQARGSFVRDAVARGVSMQVVVILRQRSAWDHHDVAPSGGRGVFAPALLDVPHKGAR